MRARVLTVVLLVVGIRASSIHGEDKDKPPPLDRAELDKMIVKSVYDTASEGTKIFNNGNREGCYRLYQGTLMVIHPLLKDYRPKLSLSVREKLERSKAMNAVDGAFALRAALDEIQNEIAPGAKGEVKKTGTLWERLGSTGGVSKALDQIIARAAEDSKVNFLRGKKPDANTIPNLKQNLLEFISENTGGPLKYKGKDMKTAHAGMKITNDEFNALAAIVKDVLEKNNVADADVKEFMGILETTRKDIVEVKTKD
jgi:hemoglobin